MKISKRCEYALKALMELSKDDGRELKNLRDLSASAKVPYKFLEQIMIDLRRAGWVASVRGKEGGYRLDISPSKLTMREIVERIDEHVIVKKNNDDQAEKFEGLYATLFDLGNQISNELEKISLSSLRERTLDIQQDEANKWSFCI